MLGKMHFFYHNAADFSGGLDKVGWVDREFKTPRNESAPPVKLARTTTP